MEGSVEQLGEFTECVLMAHDGLSLQAGAEEEKGEKRAPSIKETLF